MMRLRAGSLIQFGVVVLLAAAPWWHVLSLPMTTCDSWPLIESSVNSSWGQLFTSRLMEGTTFEFNYYRPVVMLSYRFNHAVAGLHPWVYHATDLGAHVIASVLLWLVLSRLSAGLLPLVATLVFLAHPVLVEVVPGVARRQDLLMGMFGLATCYAVLRAAQSSSPAARRGWLAGTILLFFLTTLTKDYAVVFLLPVLVLWFGFGPGKRWLMAAGLGVAAVLWFLLRSSALQGLTMPLHPSYAEFFKMCNYSLFGLFPLPAEWLLLVLAVFLIAIVIAIASAHKDDTRRHQTLAPDAIVLLFGVCLALPIMAVMAVTGRFAMFYGYVPVMGFAVLSGFFLSRAGSLVFSRSDSVRRTAGIAGLAVAVGMTLCTAAHLTWFVRYPGWSEANHIAQDYLDSLGELVDASGDQNVIVCVDIPRRYRPAGRLVAQSCSILRNYSIASWLRLTRPGQPWQVTTGVWVDWRRQPEKMELASVNPSHAAVFRCRIERASGWLLQPFKNVPGAPTVSEPAKTDSLWMADVKLEHGTSEPLVVVYQADTLQVRPL